MLIELPGRVVAVHGRHYLVRDDDGVVSCVTRGRKGGVACNDRVVFCRTGPGEGVIERVLPRANLLYRSDRRRSKLLAANVDRVLVVTAAVPPPNGELLDRCLVAAEAAGIPAAILVNKADLPETPGYHEQLGFYESLGYPRILVSALGDVSTLLPELADRTTVLVGASGVGKSTLINALHPGAQAATAGISVALAAGRHTTTHTSLYSLPTGGALIDSPGMQEFGLAHLSLSELQAAFPELPPLAGFCRFHDCRHIQEPDCAVLEAVREGVVRKERWRNYRNLLREIDTPAY